MSAQDQTALFDDRSRYVDRFGLLLGLTVITVIALSLVDLREPFGDAGSELGFAVVTVLAGSMFLIALRASGVAHRWQTLADILVGLSVTIVLGVLLYDLVVDEDLSGLHNGGAPFFWLTLAALTPIAVVRRLLTHRQVTTQTLLGAIATYLLIAVAFNYAFLTADAYQTPFFGEPEATTSFMYYSLVTATTLGYGDLAASTDLGRLLSTSAAVIGQVFLVTFVAMLVGLLAQARRRPVQE